MSTSASKFHTPNKSYLEISRLSSGTGNHIVAMYDFKTWLYLYFAVTNSEEMRTPVTILVGVSKWV